ncbi:hypothetical protein RHMOL_Rhmol04G0371800 [Rhododendron molle]|uniref:Uncharacterized protein n=1 Tax=Rhododendron molle TaxID=49168 RepID=A0ACC0P9Y5_RHOML|nr:hypothetical protein RHMOL_Rhmol04G0371800 [Rhododendron molle]
MLREMVDSDVSRNANTITVLVSALSKQGRTKEAEELLEVVEGGVDLDVVTYNSLMVGYCLQGQMDEAMRLLNAMADGGIRPDTYSYNILIQGYCKNMKLDEAMHLFRQMPLQG